VFPAEILGARHKMLEQILNHYLADHPPLLSTLLSKGIEQLCAASAN